MRRLLIISLLFMVHFSSNAQTYKVMTFNIRLDVPKDGENNWEHRKASLTKLIKSYHPDIFGIQEGLPHQVHYLDSTLQDYTYVGVGREDGKEKGEFSALYFDTTRLDIIHHSTFWLSGTSEIPSVGWDAALPRICTYGLFEDKETKQRFWIFNTHFDHVGIMARNGSATLIIQKMKEVNTENVPVVIMGDLNSENESEAIKILSYVLEDATLISKNPLKGPSGTFNGFEIDQPITRRIDYIFVNNFIVDSIVHINDKRENNLNISDHLPVMAELEIPSND